MNCVTPDQVRDFYRAAASFYRQAPWRSVGGDEPIQVECEQHEGGPWFAIVLGKKGKIRGLWLCDDWEPCFLIERGAYEAIADRLQYTALHFGDRSQISPNDLDRPSDSASRLPVPGRFPPSTAPSGAVITGSRTPGNWNCWKPASG